MELIAKAIQEGLDDTLGFEVRVSRFEFESAVPYLTETELEHVEQFAQADVSGSAQVASLLLLTHAVEHAEKDRKAGYQDAAIPPEQLRTRMWVDEDFEDQDYRHRAEYAIDAIRRFGSIDGAHHKQWVIDQALRHLLGDEYAEWVANRNADKDYEPWDVGIAP